MRLATSLLTAALLAAGAGRAAAQTISHPAPPPPALAGVDEVGPVRSHWAAAAFVGSNIEEGETLPNVDERDKLAIGAQLGYLWRGILGGEFLVESGRAFDVSDSAFVAGPRLNSFMANVIAAVPFGSVGQFQPFVSGGVGWVAIVSEFTPQLAVTPVAANETPTESTTVRQHTPAMNVGGGFMAFAGNVGFRGDVRYYHTDRIQELSGTAAEQATQALLSDIPFWRASVGLAFQW